MLRPRTLGHRSARLAAENEQLRRRVSALERQYAELGAELERQRRRHLLPLPADLLSPLSSLFFFAVLVASVIVSKALSFTLHYAFFIGLAVAVTLLIWYGNWLARRRM